LKPYLVREAAVSSTKCINNGPLITVSLQSKQLQADYASSHLKSIITYLESLVNQKTPQQARSPKTPRRHVPLKGETSFAHNVLVIFDELPLIIIPIIDQDAE
jgi:hypothetical protein